MMHPAEPDARPQGTFWMLDLRQPLPVGPVPPVPVAFTRVGPEVAQELAGDGAQHWFAAELVFHVLTECGEYGFHLERLGRLQHLEDP